MVIPQEEQQPAIVNVKCHKMFDIRGTRVKDDSCMKQFLKKVSAPKKYVIDTEFVRKKTAYLCIVSRNGKKD